MVKRIYILGRSGPDTFALERNIRTALAAAGLPRCTIRIFDDEEMYLKYGIGLLPSLVIDETVRVIGRIPPVEELLNIFYLIGACQPKPGAPVWNPKID